MKIFCTPRSWLAAAMVTLLISSVLSPTSQAGLIVNGGFETGLAGWTTADQLGSAKDSTFALQSGTMSPDGFIVPAPPGGIFAAMSNAGLGGPGSHVLYQDFVIPSNQLSFFQLSFDLFIGNRAVNFFTPSPATLDFSTPNRNQQARVDIVRAAADPFSVEAFDVLLNVYQTKSGDPLISGYQTIFADLSSLIAANGGQTVRLRFAEVDNDGFFQLGVDNVQIDAVPEPTSLAIFGMGALIGLAYCARRRGARR